jgi:Mitochondrial carrier protein
MQMSTGFKTFCSGLSSSHDTEAAHNNEHFTGGLGSFTFWFFGIPADNVKKYVIRKPSYSPHIPNAHLSSRIMGRSLDVPPISALRVAEDIYRNLGWRGFYRGLTPCFLRAFPANASALFVYEGLMKGLKAEKARWYLLRRSWNTDISHLHRLELEIPIRFIWCSKYPVPRHCYIYQYDQAIDFLVHLRPSFWSVTLS